jgi:hypothetical protein
MWEEEYMEYLGDNGFLADFDIGHRQHDPDVRVGIKTEMKVNQLQEEVKDLRQQIAVMNQQAFNVLLFILAVIVALVLWK